MLCSNCGKEFQEDSGICPSCGSAQTPPQQQNAGDGKSSKNSGSRVLRILLSVVLSLVLVLSACAALLVANVRMAFTENSLNNMLGGISLEDIPVEQVLGDQLESYDEMADWLEDVIYQETQIEADISQEKLEQFLEESTVLPFLSGELSEYIGGIFSGTYQAETDKEEIVDLILDNTELLEDTFDVVIGEQEAQRIAEWVDSSGTLETLTLREPAEGSEIKAALDLVHRLFSDTTLGILIGVAVFMVVLLFAVNRKAPGSALCFAGVPLIISGGLVSLLGLLTSLLSSALASAFGGGELAGKLIHGALSAGRIPSLAVLIVGIAALISGIVLKKCSRA